MTKRSILFFFLLLTCFARNAHAAFNHDACKPNCYVATTGNDSTGNGTIGNPWLTLGKCFNEAYPGDTCWFRGGTYYSPDTSADPSIGYQESCKWGWALGLLTASRYATTRTGHGGAAGNPVTIRGYPGETVIFASPIGAGGPCTVIRFLDGVADYVSFYDITFKSGEVHLGLAATGLSFERCIFHQQPKGGDNSCMLGAGYNGTGLSNIIIRNNLFISDSTDRGPRPYDGGTGWMLNNGQNQQMTDLYSLSNSLVEHNDFVVTPNSTNNQIMSMIGFKAWDQTTTVQYNYVANLANTNFTYRGIWMGNWMDSPGGNVVRYNVAINAGGIYNQYKQHNDDYYNNTFYNSPSGCWSTLADATGIQVIDHNRFFNNICVAGAATGSLYLNFGDYILNGQSLVNRQDLLDYNIYWKVGSGARVWKNNQTNISDTGGITAWQTYLDGQGVPSFENNSRLIDPGLVNPAAGNFALSAGAAARTGGRGGSYPTFIGADDPNSTSDYIGCNFDPRCHGYSGGGTDTTPPAKPTGLRVN